MAIGIPIALVMLGFLYYIYLSRRSAAAAAAAAAVNLEMADSKGKYNGEGNPNVDLTVVPEEVDLVLDAIHVDDVIAKMEQMEVVENIVTAVVECVNSELAIVISPEGVVEDSAEL